MKKLQTGRNQFIINQCFSLKMRSKLQSVIYFVLASELIYALMYLNVVFWNVRIQNDSLRGFSGGMFVSYPDFTARMETPWYDIVDGKIQLMKNHAEVNAEAFYRSVEVAFYGEDRAMYAFEPWKVADNGEFTIYAVDEDSLKGFDWPLRRGRYFGEDVHEVLAFQGMADVGDMVFFEKDGGRYECRVVGVLDIKWMPARLQSDQYPSVSRHLDSTNAYELKLYNLINTNLNQGYLLHPKSHLASREHAVSGGGVYIRQEGCMVDGKRDQERLKKIQHGEIIEIGAWDWSGGSGQWLLKSAGKAVFYLTAMLLWIWQESKRRYKKFREEFRIWNICGMSKKSIERIFAQVMLLPAGMGIMKGLVQYLWRYGRIPSHFWSVLMIFCMAGAYMLTWRLVLKNNLEAYVPLEKNEGKAFLGNRVAVNFPLLAWWTVYENIQLPLVLKGLSETEVIKGVERCMAIAFIVPISQQQCCNLTPYEQFRVKVARALCDSPQVLYVGREWDALWDNEKKEMERYFEQIRNTLGTRIEFNQW